ncbi:FRG domain-containing protein [Christensenellaceae bacterium OttesenSCG-928-M15]|nr:FRG domain-containing protein [Christensenellaceae bacterium OttesenSCG-928-M15]
MVIRRVRDYLEAIDAIATQYGVRSTKEALLFRGISDHQFCLLPGVYRTFLAEAGGGAVERPQYGDATESEILHHFIKNAMSLVDSIDRDDLLTWLTYAQHFGAPTRLMDFSANPLVSLYFACRREFDVDGAVCVLHEKNYVQSLRLDRDENRKKRDVLNEIMDNISDPCAQCTPYPVTFIPHFIDARMEAQNSRFLIWGSVRAPFEELAGPYGSMLDGEEEAFFCKLKIDASKKMELLRELSFLGVNEKKLFPGLDGIGKYVAQYYRRTKEDYPF